MEHQSWSGEIAEWEHPSAEQFFPLEDGGFQDVILDVPEPQRAQLTRVLLSYPNVITTTPGRTTLVQHYISSPSAAEAIPNPLFTKRTGETRAGSDVEGKGDQTIYKSLGIPNCAGYQEGWRCKVLCGL